MYFRNVFVCSYLNQIDENAIEYIFKDEIQTFQKFIESIDEKINQLNTIALSSSTQESAALGQAINEFYREYSNVVQKLSKFHIILKEYLNDEIKYFYLLFKDEFLKKNLFEYKTYLQKERQQKNEFLKKLNNFSKEKDFVFLISLHDFLVFSLFQQPSYNNVDEKTIEYLNNNGEYKKKLFLQYLIILNSWRKLCRRKFEKEIINVLRRRRDEYFKMLFKLLEIKKYDSTPVKKIYTSLYSVTHHLKIESKSIKYKDIFSNGLLPLSEIFS